MALSHPRGRTHNPIPVLNGSPLHSAKRGTLTGSRICRQQVNADNVYNGSKHPQTLLLIDLPIDTTSSGFRRRKAQLRIIT